MKKQIINNSIFYKIVEISIIDKSYFKIRKTITNDKIKFRNIILKKYFVIDEILYYKDRL